MGQANFPSRSWKTDGGVESPLDPPLVGRLQPPLERIDQGDLADHLVDEGLEILLDLTEVGAQVLADGR